MKAKYRHYGNDCIIYNQVICEDNIVVEVTTYNGWGMTKPEIQTHLCDNEQKAINVFNTICDKLKHNKYDCEYRS